MDALSPYVASGDIPGIVAVVAKGDDVDVTVIGDQALGGAPMREDSLFRIASAGKPITAVAVLTLVADGKVAIDDREDDLLPELAKPRVLPPDEWMAHLSEIPLLHQPGEGYTYNTAFDILGVLVARASGQPFADYVNQRMRPRWEPCPRVVLDCGRRPSRTQLLDR